MSSIRCDLEVDTTMRRVQFSSWKGAFDRFSSRHMQSENTHSHSHTIFRLRDATVKTKRTKSDWIRFGLFFPAPNEQTDGWMDGASVRENKNKTTWKSIHVPHITLDAIKSESFSFVCLALATLRRIPPLSFCFFFFNSILHTKTVRRTEWISSSFCLLYDSLMDTKSNIAPHHFTRWPNKPYHSTRSRCRHPFSMRAGKTERFRFCFHPDRC